MHHSFFLHYIADYQLLSYAIIFVAMIFEGDITLFSIGFLVHQGFLDVGDVLFFVLAGIFLGDTLWFFLGKKAARRTCFLSRWLKKTTVSFDNHLKERPFHTVFLSKFAYGYHHILLARAGMIKIPFRSFLRADPLASLLWVLIVGGLGYFAGTAYSSVRYTLRFVETGLLGAALIFVVLDKFIIGKQIQKKL